VLELLRYVRPRLRIQANIWKVMLVHKTSERELGSVRTSDVSLSIFVFPRPSPSLFNPFQQLLLNHVPSVFPLLHPITFFLVGSLDDIQLLFFVHGDLCEQHGPFDRKRV